MRVATGRWSLNFKFQSKKQILGETWADLMQDFLLYLGLALLQSQMPVHSQGIAASVVATSIASASA